MVVIHTAGMLY